MPDAIFLHSHGAELDGKVIVPICTSGKSAGRKTLSDVLRLCPQSHVATLMCIKRDEMPRAVEIVEGWVPYIRSLSRVEDWRVYGEGEEKGSHRQRCTHL